MMSLGLEKLLYLNETIGKGSREKSNQQLMDVWDMTKGAKLH